jgi:hypothetical protein
MSRPGWLHEELGIPREHRIIGLKEATGGERET